MRELGRKWTRRAVLRGAWWSVAAALAGGLLGGWSVPARAAGKRRGRWECQNDQCEPYVYDPAVGVPDFDIPPGVRFEDLPDDWICPVCGDSKRQFQPLD